MTTRRPRRRPGENRERLVEAGLVEFGLFGYHGASTAAIAARAEVPQPHLYASFRTKQELFAACCDRALARLEADAPGTVPDEALCRFLYQAVAIVRLPALRPMLPARVASMRDALGDAGFGEALGVAALSLGDSADD